MSLSSDPDNPRITFPPHHVTLDTSDYKMLISILLASCGLSSESEPFTAQPAWTHELTIIHP